MTRSLEQQHLSATFPPALISARRARDFVRTGLAAIAVDHPTLADRLCLITSELVTNAVLHAGTDIEVCISVDDHDVWIEVADEAPTHPFQAAPSLSSTRGRGLILVDGLADAWGVADVEGRAGKRVWIRASRV